MPFGGRLLNRGCRSNNADVLAYCYRFSRLRVKAQG